MKTQSELSTSLQNALSNQLLAHLGRIPTAQEIEQAGRKFYRPETLSTDFYFMDMLLLSISITGKITLHPKQPKSAPVSSGSAKSQVSPSSDMDRVANVQGIAVTTSV